MSCGMIGVPMDLTFALWKQTSNNGTLTKRVCATSWIWLSFGFVLELTQKPCARDGDQWVCICLQNQPNKTAERQTSVHTSVRTFGVILSPFYIILWYSVYYPIILSESKEQGQDTQPFLWWSCRILPFSPRLADLVMNKIHSHILWFQNVCFLYPAW